jgi:hypothetical protein
MGLALHQIPDWAQYTVAVRDLAGRRVKARPSVVRIDSHSRFAVRRYLGVKPFPSQIEFLHLARRSRFCGFSGPVGTGKSFALGALTLQCAAANPGLPGIVAAPTYRMLKDVTIPSVMEVLIRSRTQWRSGGQETLYLPEFDSTIRFRSMDKPERLIGQNLAWFGVDELTYCKEDAWKRLEARLREPRSRHLNGFAVWTPKGFDWVWKRFISPEKKKGYEAITAKPFENRAILDNVPDFYERLKESYDERFYEQEVLGKYLNINSGAVYWAFDRVLNGKRLPYMPGVPIRWCIDFNVSPMCSVLAQVFDNGYPQDKRLHHVHVFDELVLKNTNTQRLCEEFHRKVVQLKQPGRPVQVIAYGDHSGWSRRTSSQEVDWQIIRSYFSQHQVRLDVELQIRVPTDQNPLVRSRLAAVNARLCNMRGERRLTVDVSACPWLVADLEQVRYPVTATGRVIPGELDKSDPERTHSSDALGYMIEEEYPVQQPSGFLAGTIA